MSQRLLKTTTTNLSIPMPRTRSSRNASTSSPSSKSASTNPHPTRTPPPTLTPQTTHHPPLPTPSLTSRNLRMSYTIARGEQGVLTFEPYKSILLPHWRFRSLPIAQESCGKLEVMFREFVEQGDFVGADMARKFVQMGMTRAKRYANHKGGRKYEKSELELEREGQKGAKRTQLPKSTGHTDQEEKLAASEIFKKGWRRCIEDEGYLKLKVDWQKEKKAWEKAGGVPGKREGAKAEYDLVVKREPKDEEVEEVKVKVEEEGEEEKEEEEEKI